MPPRPGLPETARRLAVPGASALKPPEPPTFPTRLAQQPRPIEVQAPPLIAGALVAAFAKAVADGLGNELLTHYYLAHLPVRVNLDRVVDRLLASFTHELWDELHYFYHEDPGPDTIRQVKLLFDGPVRQIVLLLNGPEAGGCLLDRLGPGLSRRRPTWSSDAGGIDLPLALQLLCRFWQREKASQFPSGTSDEIARVLHSRIVTGTASAKLMSEIRAVLLSPHYVQMHIGESVVWNVLLATRTRPAPADGFHVVQLKYECQLFGPLDGIGDPELVRIGSLPAVTGTADECVSTSVSDYTAITWPQCGLRVLRCLEEAVAGASRSGRDGDTVLGMAVWDAANSEGPAWPGLRFIHVEVERAEIRLTVAARVPVVVEVFQQMSWVLAALSASPFPGALSQCVAEVSGWTHDHDSACINCTLAHQPVPSGHGPVWLRQIGGAAVARGFPIRGLPTQQGL
ncbi:hypothetical protein CDD83_6868 [Cordyceps sp. RAO-2017]|nr:hypothetical protein CDD83_6868 [Cordyceps sp. RAO-2017]